MLHTRYSVHLVYALAPNHAGLDGEHQSEIRQTGYEASEARGVRLVGGGAEPDDDLINYPIDRGDGTMEIELGWFQIAPVEHVHGPDHAVAAQLSVISGGGLTVRGLIVEGMEFRPLYFV